MEQSSVSVIGLGKMGGAIARMLSSDYTVSGYDIEEVRMPQRINVVSDMSELLTQKSITVIAVKPNQVASVVSQIPDNRLIISVAAGVSINKIDGHRKVPGPTVRVMPNMPLMVGKGMSVLYANEVCSANDKALALSMFECGGEAFYIQNETLMHSVTAISGSGPAFIELFMQTMEDGAVLLGIPRESARRLVTQTFLGTSTLVSRAKRSPQDHIHDVTSPGGTTAAGLQALKDFSMEKGLLRALQRAAKRSRELGD